MITRITFLEGNFWHEKEKTTGKLGRQAGQTDRRTDRLTYYLLTAASDVAT